ncbi:MAG: MXAN_6640 family putative metalloprotease [Anaerolineales bacterium]
MHKFAKIVLVAALSATILLFVGASSAQAPAVEVVEVPLTADLPTAMYSVDLLAGDTLYAYAGSAVVDPFLTICADQACSVTLAANDDIDFEGGNLNSAAEYTATEDGSVFVRVRDCCNPSVEGPVQLSLGVNAPEVLTGEAQPTGDALATQIDMAAIVEAQRNRLDNLPPNPVQEFAFNVTPETPRRYYDLFGMRAGDTIYLYVESEQIDTYLILCDINCEETFAENDDIDFAAGNTNSALEFTFQQDGDYSVFVSDCCNEEPTGDFRIQIGINAPEVLTGQAQPNTDELAELWRPDPVVVQPLARTDAVTCEAAVPQERPVLSGPVQTLETPNFIIHFTEEGVDAARASFAQQIQTVVEEMVGIQTSQGWPLPPSDCGEGGDERIDIYLQEITGETGALGFAAPGNVVADNPNTPDKVETWAAYAYMVLDNDFSFAPNPASVMRATLAHEWHHIVQFGYDFGDLLWFYEGTAVWMETQTFPADQDAVGYTVEVLQTPDLCVGAEPEGSLRVYGEWTHMDTLARDLGQDGMLRLWELLGDFDGMEPYYLLLEEFGTTPQAVQLNLAVRNLLRDNQLGALITDSVRYEGAIEGPGQYVPAQDGVQELGVDYLFIAVPGVYSFRASQPNLAVFFVGVNITNNVVEVFDVTNGEAVDTSSYEFADVIIMNTLTHQDPAACRYTNWILTVEDGTGAPPAEPLPLQFDATYYPTQ